MNGTNPSLQFPIRRRRIPSREPATGASPAVTGSPDAAAGPGRGIEPLYGPAPFLGTMMDVELSVASLLRHGVSVHGRSPVVSYDARWVRRTTFAVVARRAAQLAHALHRLGVRQGDRVATLAANHQEHLEAYLAVPSMGAVLHTLNPRLSTDQLAYIVEHARDRVLLVDGGHMPVFEALDVEPSGFDWPQVPERAAAAMCYTSGTTGNPKGVIYSHRSCSTRTPCAPPPAWASPRPTGCCPSSPCSTANGGAPLCGLDDRLRLRPAGAAAAGRSALSAGGPRRCLRCGTTCCATPRPTPSI
jgi:hypothetical protein